MTVEVKMCLLIFHPAFDTGMFTDIDVYTTNSFPPPLHSGPRSLT